ncbi:sperm-associated antigen 7-like [Homarus americanus]|uniref:Sperm-associated antigen 7-like n=1 Tax=Homarus americanus TaxID=6706 RepID=A0A8J5JCR1_HOMAM|nr:sperm-associated antigen 7-like [Homarus americanus]KAG7154361.1 Sperm-associated antigen 7-like [Homarus americanus]
MDLLDSIMSKMDKPPSMNDKHKKLIREQQKAVEEAKSKERERLNQFRKHIEERVNRFIQNVTLMKKKFEPMERVARSIVRDVADVAGLTTYAFGNEDVDRHVMVFKKEYPLTEDELEAYKNGDEWDPEKAKETALLKEKQQQEDKVRAQQMKKDPGSSKFIEKYERLVGKETGKESARILEVNKQFGYVRSELKKDKRTIEEALADIRAKKMKREQGEQEGTENDTQSGNEAQP